MAALNLHQLPTLEDLPRAPASEVKKDGWRGIVRRIRGRLPLLVTNHNQPEAVVLEPDVYRVLVESYLGQNVEAAPALDALRARFDARLAALDAPGADERLRGVMDRPLRLGGRVKAGSSF